MLIFGIIDGQEFRGRTSAFLAMEETRIRDQQSRTEERPPAALDEYFHLIGMQYRPTRADEPLDVPHDFRGVGGGVDADAPIARTARREGQRYAIARCKVIYFFDCCHVGCRRRRRRR